MKTITYKGYQASVEFDDGSLFVKVLHIEDVLVAECDRASKAEAVARDLIDAYLADCEEEGREPAKPYKGSFNVRVTPELHKRAAMDAAEDGISLNNWVSRAIEEKLECTKLSERLDGVILSGRRAMTLQFTDIAALWAEAGLQETTQVPGRKRPTWEEEGTVPSRNVALNLIKFAQRRGLHA